VIEQNLSLLLVAIPLVAAPLAALLPAGRLPWLLTLVVSWITLGLAAWQLWVVADGSVISYELGGWAPPWGIEYRIDALNALVAVIVAGIGAITLPYALRSVADEIPRWQTPYFYSAFLLCLDGLLGGSLRCLLGSRKGDVAQPVLQLENHALRRPLADTRHGAERGLRRGPPQQPGRPGSRATA